MVGNSCFGNYRSGLLKLPCSQARTNDSPTPRFFPFLTDFYTVFFTDFIVSITRKRPEGDRICQLIFERQIILWSGCYPFLVWAGGLTKPWNNLLVPGCLKILASRSAGWLLHHPLVRRPVDTIYIVEKGYARSDAIVLTPTSSTDCLRTSWISCL